MLRRKLNPRIDGRVAATTASLAGKLPIPPSTTPTKPLRPYLYCQTPHAHNNSFCSRDCNNQYKQERKPK